MPKQAPWTIRIGRKAEILDEFEVPYHKLGVNDLKALLRALVVRYRTKRPNEMVNYYVNRRLGHPQRLPFADVIWAYDLDRCQVGYACGNWDCYATAMHLIPPEQAQAIKNELRRGKVGSSQFD